MKGQNYSTLIEHKSRFVIPVVGEEIQNVPLLLLSGLVSMILVGILSAFAPGLFLLFAGIGIVVTFVVSAIFGERDEVEKISVVKLLYYEGFKKYRYILTTTGTKQYLKPKKIYTDYKKIKYTYKKRKE